MFSLSVVEPDNSAGLGENEALPFPEVMENNNSIAKSPNVKTFNLALCAGVNIQKSIKAAAIAAVRIIHLPPVPVDKRAANERRDRKKKMYFILSDTRYIPIKTGMVRSR